MGRERGANAIEGKGCGAAAMSLPLPAFGFGEGEAQAREALVGSGMGWLVCLLGGQSQKEKMDI